MALPTHQASKDVREQFLKDLNDVESPATAQMMQQYKIAMDRIAATMARVLKGGDAHSAAMLAGHETDIRIAMIQGRASYILGELDRFGAQGAAIMRDLPKQAVALGMAHATDRLSTLSGAMVKPNPRRVAAMAARMSDGTPQRAYLDQFATRVTQNAVDSMTQGVLMGNHPDVILRDLSSQMSGGGANLATFVRSNVMGAARDGLTATMQDNSDVCTGWLWNCAEDDSTCDVCWAMNGTQHDVSEEMDSHPNAVFAESAFVPYGALEEIVASRYNGPAVLVTAEVPSEGTHRITIGPNHPMLTARGMVKASEIRKGDYLVYDTRVELPGVAGPAPETDLQQVKTIEQVRDALLASGADVRIATSGHDFHGDVRWCEEEINVVRPNGQLLHVLDPVSVQDGREHGFVRANAELAVEAGHGPLGLRGVGVDLSPAGRMRGVLPSHYVFAFVESVEYSLYCGEAFDATTSTGVYNSDGFVVSNCRCIQDPTTQSYSDIVGSGGDASGGDITDSSAQAFNPDDRFRSTLSEAQQLNVLGPGKFSLFQDGKITLADLVTKTSSPTWGPGLRSTTLTELQAKGIGQAPVIDQVARGQRK